MRRQVLRLAAEHQMLPSGGLILCAVSGGMDSMCLLHLLWTLAPEEGFSVAAAHYNHHLRPGEAQRDQDFVQNWCRERGIPLYIGEGQVAEDARSQGRGVEETARRMRYGFLAQTARELGAARIATAHTADDNAETLLLHLLRGAGTQGLSGIPPRRGDIVRPLLGCTRSQIEDYCAAHSLPHVEDSSNADEGYTRNFLRRQVMPLLRQRNPRATQAISSAAERLREEHLFLDDLAREQAARLGRPQADGLYIQAEALASLPPALRARTARKLLEAAGGGRNCTSAHLEALLALCETEKPSARLSLPGLSARREYETLILSPAAPPPPVPPPTAVRLEGVTSYGGWLLHCHPCLCPPRAQQTPGAVCLNREGLEGQLILRPRQAGDQIQLPGRPNKSLKKLLIEARLPAGRRERLPILADEAGVLAAAGFGPQEARLAKPGQAALEIRWERRDRDGTNS
ncbi:MAG: tRNA lysidine(34) synthetase TilS [Oscillospiraceae bacterium]|nr:tRNA lysidine(34) synthetase TilS [Oscillospiraceae bacterium]